MTVMLPRLILRLLLYDYVLTQFSEVSMVFDLFAIFEQYRLSRANNLYFLSFDPFPFLSIAHGRICPLSLVHLVVLFVFSLHAANPAVFVMILDVGMDLYLSVAL